MERERKGELGRDDLFTRERYDKDNSAKIEMDEFVQLVCDWEVSCTIDRFQRDKSDPSVIVFSEIKRCQRPHFTQFFQKAKSLRSPAA